MRASVLIVAALLTGCAAKPPEPDWKADAAGSLQAFGEAWLKGETRAADVEFARARRAMSSTGRADLVAHAELYRCGARVASLDFDECPGYAALAQDASPAERAYAAYLTGQWAGLDANLLPEQHRAVVGGPLDAPKLAAVSDPLARQVAAGALLRAGRITPADIGTAIQTASSQGWRRALLAWLGVALKRAQAAGDLEEAARIQRRIELAST
ncbi:MAG: hypothetical protein ACLGI6_22250 [Gammaproteobacteria bacterium]